ncbi:Origin of replication complex subunit 6, partial [Linum grandiflorum]
DFFVFNFEKVKKAAVDIVRDLTGSDDGLMSLSRHAKIVLPSLSRLLSEKKEVSEPAGEALVNLSQNSSLGGKMVDMGMIRMAMELLYRPDSTITRLLVMLLVNLTQLDAGISSLLQTDDEKMRGLHIMKLVRSFCRSSNDNKDDPFDHVGSVLVNISQKEAGRKLLMDPKRGLLKQILRQFDSTSPLRKKGIYSKEDVSKMPAEVSSALSIEREPWDDPDIRVQALEAIYFVIMQETGLRSFWSVNGPRILQIGYEDEADPRVIEAYERAGSWTGMDTKSVSAHGSRRQNSCRENHRSKSQARQGFKNGTLHAPNNLSSRHIRHCCHLSSSLPSSQIPPLPSVPVVSSKFHQLNPPMDISEIAKRLGLSDSKQLVRKAAEIRRLCDVQFDSSVIGVGEVCKAVMCLEIAATRFQVIFDRKIAMKLSGMSEKAYTRSFNLLQNSIGVKTKLDVRALAIQFGCVRIIPCVQKGLSLYKDRFLASLPVSRRASADFTRPVFTAVAFYLSAKKQKLKIDKDKLIEVCGTSESEFLSVANSMKDMCFDVFGISKEKTDPKEVKGNRDLLDALPEKRRVEDGGYSSDDGAQVSSYKKRKRSEKQGYEKWKTSVLASNKKKKSSKESCKKARQTSLNNFLREVPADSTTTTTTINEVEA